MIWWCKTFRSLRLEVGVENILGGLENVEAGFNPRAQPDGDGYWNFCNAIRTIFFWHGKRDYTKRGKKQWRKPHSIRRKFRYSYEDFFKVFGKGEEDQATIESWEASSKNIKNTGALLYPAGNQDLLPHINWAIHVVYSVVKQMEYIAQFGEDFKSHHLETILKMEKTKLFIKWFAETFPLVTNRDTHKTAVSLILSSMLSYRTKQVIEEARNFISKYSDGHAGTFRTHLLGADYGRAQSAAVKKKKKRKKKKEKEKEKAVNVVCITQYGKKHV